MRKFAVGALAALLCLGVVVGVQALRSAYATDAPPSVTITDVHHAPGWDMGYIASSGGIGYCGDKNMNYPSSGGVYSGPRTARSYFGEVNGRALDWVMANGYRNGHETAAGLTGDYAALATQGAVWAIIHGEAGRQGYSNPTVVAAVDALLAGAYAYAGGDSTIDGCAWVYSPYADFIQPYVLYVEQERSGSLEVRKVVQGEGADPNALFKFDIALRDPDGHDVNATFGPYTFSGGRCSVTVSQNSPAIISGIPEGCTYTVSEDTSYNTGYTLAGITGGSGSISSGQASVVIGTNNRSGNLKIQKVVTGEDADPDATFRFDVTLRDSSGHDVNATFGSYTFSGGRCSVLVSQNASVTIPGIPVNYTYSVEEDTSYVAGYVLTGITGGSGTIGSGSTVTATGTNRRGTWSISIDKDFGGHGGEDGHVFYFDVELTDEDGHAVNGTFSGRTFSGGKCRVSMSRSDPAVRIEGIPTYYSYTVTEVEDADYEFERWESNDDTAQVSGRSVRGKPTKDGTTVTSVCTNRRKPGYGKVVKVSSV